MTDTSPIWLLDFDGVVNAISRKGDLNVWPQWESGVLESSPGCGFSILWAPEVARTVAEAHRAGVRVVWLSTWREATARIPSLITDIPEGLEWWGESTLEAAGHGGDDGYGSAHWKNRCAKNLLPPDVPVLWTDDDLDFFQSIESSGWFDSMSHRLTGICPNPMIGLSRKQVIQIKEWISEVA